VALLKTLGCGCIFSFGHFRAHWFGPPSLRRWVSNGISGSRLYQERGDWDAVDRRRSRVNGWCFFVLVDLPAVEEGAGARDRYSLLMPLHFKISDR